MSKRLGVLVHHHRPEVLHLAKDAIDWCGEQIQPVVCPEDGELLHRPDLIDKEFGRDLDACLSLGGDGTMLRAVSLVSQHGVPILGVNAGQLGYLTEVDPEHMVEALQQWVEGQLTVETRMMLEVTSPQHPDWVGYALNEAVVNRAESGRSVEVSAAIDDRHFTTYLVDGLIVSTPTGSTAYSLSAGGPIVEPDFHALLLTPVAAHMVFNRSMVLAPTTKVGLTVEGYRSAVLSLDGQTVLNLEPEETVCCRAAEWQAKFLVSGNRDFHTVLKDKFGLSDR